MHAIIFLVWRKPEFRQQVFEARAIHFSALPRRISNFRHRFETRHSMDTIFFLYNTVVWNQFCGSWSRRGLHSMLHVCICRNQLESIQDEPLMIFCWTTSQWYVCFYLWCSNKNLLHVKRNKFYWHYSLCNPSVCQPKRVLVDLQFSVFDFCSS